MMCCGYCSFTSTFIVFNCVVNYVLVLILERARRERCLNEVNLKQLLGPFASFVGLWNIILKVVISKVIIEIKAGPSEETCCC